MLVPFTRLDGGKVFIRTEDLRAIEDFGLGEPNAQPQCRVVYVTGDRIVNVTVRGTADQVFEALVDEERRRVEDAQRQQLRVQQGYPMTPVPRGRRG